MTSSKHHISRYEIKYYVPVEMADHIKNLIGPFVKLDPYAEKVENNRYLVRSLYYDTPDLDFYYEKVDGLKVRKKLRVRTYNDFHPDNIGFLEIKRRYNNCVVKERTKIPITNIDELMKTPVEYVNRFKSSNGKYRSLHRFVYNMTTLNLEPTLLILYDRDAFMDQIDDRARLTIDYNVRMKYAPSHNEIYTNETLAPVTETQCILELKFDEFMPKWMRRLVQKVKIRPESISKYCLGIDGNFNGNKGLTDAGSHF